MWYFWTSEGVLIDAWNGTVNPGPLTAEVLSPAIATFESSEGCTPWVKVEG